MIISRRTLRRTFRFLRNFFFFGVFLPFWCVVLSVFLATQTPIQFPAIPVHYLSQHLISHYEPVLNRWFASQNGVELNDNIEVHPNTKENSIQGKNSTEGGKNNTSSNSSSIPLTRTKMSIATKIADLQSHIRFPTTQKIPTEDEPDTDTEILCIVSHPMMFLGGNMDNYVVIVLQKIMSKHLPALRFNTNNPSIRAGGEAADTEKLVRRFLVFTCLGD